ncbi:MAG: single-stranded DNA-binding protein [Saprospiraceae bacterium]|nr:single-stranded DNA-binding protein [Saprospiraceae bacterium]
MKNLKNSCQLTGHIGKNPEITTLEKGKKIARFSLATNDNYTAQDGTKVSNTTWHNIVAWDYKADYAEKHLTKGNEVVIHGRISNRSYKDKQGNTKYISEVIINEILKVQKETQAEN